MVNCLATSHSSGAKAAVLAAMLCLLTATRLSADEAIPVPDDAPLPMSPQASMEHVKLPPGYRLELVAAEPLIREPSGVCWDERGRLFVCELHGYNLEGQYDIEELNKTGKLDRSVRRIQANSQAKRAARSGTYGTVKQLADLDGDGLMDQAKIWADDLPPCYGVCAVAGGIIVACAPDIVYLADRDGDGSAEVRKTLFTGFATGALERGLNAPQLGPDGWIYFGSGHGGGRVHGPRLAEPVDLPGSDFRIKADGSAIEPVLGRTGTIGFTFTQAGDRIVTSTRSAIAIAPLPWRYLSRNPYASAPSVERQLFIDNRVYPLSLPHPWRSKRAEDPGFAKFYTDRYGDEEAAPNGYFTSLCSPLVYQDCALPELQGHLLVCEPAQNLVHRTVLTRDGPLLSAQRPPQEAESEFLASSDPWFHPIALASGPDGAIYIVDFYREIIEDYSAIPRYLQQQYGLVNGQNRGRIYRLLHNVAQPAPPSDIHRLTGAALAEVVSSPYQWRRQTARRLIVERRDLHAAPHLEKIAATSREGSALLNALQALEDLGALTPDLIKRTLQQHSDPVVRIAALRLADRHFDERPDLLEAALELLEDPDGGVQLQLALSLGESADRRAISALAQLARARGDGPWMHAAVLSSPSHCGGLLLAELLGKSGDAASDASDPECESSLEPDLGQAAGLLEPLCAAIAARRHPPELGSALTTIAQLHDPMIQASCLRGMRQRLPTAVRMVLAESSQAALKSLAASEHEEVRLHADALVSLLQLETQAEHAARMDRARQQLTDVQTPLDARLQAVDRLSTEADPAAAAILVESFPVNTPPVRQAILAAAFARQDRLSAVLDAIEQDVIPRAALNSVQKLTLLQNPSEAIRRRAERLLSDAPVDPQTLDNYAAALDGPRDLGRGEQVFQKHCAGCHEAHGIGVSVGPDLTSEFQRSELTVLQDLLAPSATITVGYATYVLQTNDGRSLAGLIARETSNSVVLRQPEGEEQDVLRRDIASLTAAPVSLMPEGLSKVLTPRDAADVIAWLRQPPRRVILVDEDRTLPESLNQGEGSAELVGDDVFKGQWALRITPPQRYAARIEGWNFRIREHPRPGEFRYLRFAWKAHGAAGVMLELADNGSWPDADRPALRYSAGKNSTDWRTIEVSSEPPEQWQVVTRDLWQDVGDITLTGIAPTAMGGPALFDGIELLRTDDSHNP